MNTTYDFSGWATKALIRCSDGRTIMPDAFKHNDGQTVPLVYNHRHNDIDAVLGHALLENHPEGVYAYCTFNETESGKTAKEMVRHGDVTALSIYANQLKQNDQAYVIHGNIREVSLVLVGANVGALIDNVIAHGLEIEEEAVIYTGESIELHHADKPKEEPEMAESNNNGEKTIGEIIETMNEDQKTVLYALVGEALGETTDDPDEGENDMKHNIFEGDAANTGSVLTHSDQMAIIELAKRPSCGSFQEACQAYAEDLAHGVFDGETVGQLLPEFELLDPKKPPIIYDDDSWVSKVLNGVTKSPVSRVRTRKADARKKELVAKGYKKGEKKTNMKQISLIGRSHEPQTIYIKDSLHRDDILDITDFDLVAYNYGVMRHTLDQTIATAIMLGDGRTEVDADKIHENRIRPVYHDEELYCMHVDVDIPKAKAALNGTHTGVHFGDNYIYAEAVITAALYSREKYKGSGQPTFFCSPHLVNVMMLARDLNGRRVRSTLSELASELNVKEIVTIEQFDNVTRETEDGETKKLLGIFVNLKDYQLGCVKGGEITKFEQFDIDFNQLKMLLETRLSGALVELYSAIALEEPVTETSAPEEPEEPDETP